MLASKVWEDQAVWTADFLRVFPRLTVSDLNELEKEYLTGLQFMVNLKASVYAKYYFELRSLSEKDQDHFPVKPLTEEGKQRLELRSRGLEQKITDLAAGQKKLRRSESVDHVDFRPRLVSLN